MAKKLSRARIDALRKRVEKLNRMSWEERGRELHRAVSKMDDATLKRRIANLFRKEEHNERD